MIELIQNYGYLIAIFPLVGTLVNGLLGRAIQERFGEKTVGIIACSSVIFSFLLTIPVFISILGLHDDPVIINNVYNWIKVGYLNIDISLLFDPLSSVMILIITGIGSLIHIYSTAYMKGDPGFYRYFAYLNLFVFSMLLLVLADNILFMFIGWFAHPIFGFLGGFWGAVSSFIEALPTWLIPGLLAAFVLFLAARWIWGFFAARKTPAGYGKFSDDDVFRVVFAAVGSILVAFMLLWIGNQVVQTTQGPATVGEQLREGLSNLFLWAETRFTGDSGAPIDWQSAAVELRGTGGFVQYSTTGVVITPPFFAIWIGVTLYTASFIAEIVRGGILAVSKGQTEASQAVGLTRSQYLRLIILPQAFRIIMPPLGNQYLNLAKNTSLGLAVAYADIVSVGNTLINQTGQSLPVILVWMAFFLTVSLTISAIVNYYNRKLKLVER